MSLEVDIQTAYEAQEAAETTARDLESRIRKIHGAAGLLPPRQYGQPIDRDAIAKSLTLRSLIAREDRHLAAYLGISLDTRKADAEIEARRISERTKEALAAAKARGVRLGGYRPGAAKKSDERKQKAVAEAEELRGVIEPMVVAGLTYRSMAKAQAGVGKLSSTGMPLAPAQIGRILQRLGLSEFTQS